MPECRGNACKKIKQFCQRDCLTGKGNKQSQRKIPVNKAEEMPARK
jgi:hypothetical protein